MGTGTTSFMGPKERDRDGVLLKNADRHGVLPSQSPFFFCRHTACVPLTFRLNTK